MKSILNRANALAEKYNRVFSVTDCCCNCLELFSLARKREFCRFCGNNVCPRCSKRNRKHPLTKKAKKICDVCFEENEDKKKLPRSVILTTEISSKYIGGGLGLRCIPRTLNPEDITIAQIKNGTRIRVVHTTRALDDKAQMMAKIENLETSSWQYGYVRVKYLSHKKYARSDSKPAFPSDCPSVPWKPPHKLNIHVISAQKLPPGEGGIFAKILYGGLYREDGRLHGGVVVLQTPVGKWSNNTLKWHSPCTLQLPNTDRRELVLVLEVHRKGEGMLGSARMFVPLDSVTAMRDYPLIQPLGAKGLVRVRFSWVRPKSMAEPRARPATGESSPRARPATGESASPAAAEAAEAALSPNPHGALANPHEGQILLKNELAFLMQDPAPV